MKMNAFSRSKFPDPCENSSTSKTVDEWMIPFIDGMSGTFPRHVFDSFAGRLYVPFEL